MRSRWSLVGVTLPRLRGSHALRAAASAVSVSVRGCRAQEPWRAAGQLGASRPRRPAASADAFYLLTRGVVSPPCLGPYSSGDLAIVALSPAAVE